jgi:hypothetical protein
VLNNIADELLDLSSSLQHPAMILPMVRMVIVDIARSMDAGKKADSKDIQTLRVRVEGLRDVLAQYRAAGPSEQDDASILSSALVQGEKALLIAEAHL